MIEKFTVNTPYPVGAVHFYRKSYKDFFVMFDTGPNTDEAKSYLNKMVDLKKTGYVFLTHCHVDHYGLADYIAERSDAKIVMSRYDFIRHDLFEKRVDAFLEMFKLIGFNESEISSFERVFRGFKKEAPFPQDVLILEESENLLKELQINYMRCAGHSQSDIIYLTGNYAISGDVILRNIFQTPLLDVDVDNLDKRFDNYGYFVKSLLKLKNIDNMKFMPGHRDFIDSVDERISFYIDKLLNRAISINNYLRDYGVVYTLKKIVGTVEANPLTAYLKLSEVLFINDLLSNTGLLKDSLRQINLLEPFREKIEKAGD